MRAIQVVKANNRGFTLIELLVAMFITLVVMLATYATTEIAMRTNLKNMIRDEGIKVSEQIINQIRNIPIEELPTGKWTNSQLQSYLGYTKVVKKLRNFTVSFTPEVTVTSLADDLVQVDLNVNWSFREKQYTNTISTLIRK